MDDEVYERLFDALPEAFTSRLWKEGYAEGIMQERNGIVDLEVELPPKPSPLSECELSKAWKGISEQSSKGGI